MERINRDREMKGVQALGKREVLNFVTAKD